ncbi:MAG: hypothetical protein JO218_16560 [Burkholderiales bacterium]|nr:hypothetical protein [Burkholderiales bacterium]
MKYQFTAHLSYRVRLSALAATLLAGCAEKPLIPPPLNVPQHTLAESNEQARLAELEKSKPSTSLQVQPGPTPPPGRSANYKAPAAQPVDANEKATITLSFDQMPLPTFIQVVYGSILKKSFSMDPQVAARQDLVTLRSGTPQKPSEVLETARSLLASYGVAVTDVGGFYRIVPNNNTTGFSPEIRRGRALPDTPQALRPIYQLVELQAVRPAEVSQWLKQMFANKLQVQDDIFINAVMLSGQSADVQAALEVVQVLDQPRLHGRHSIRITPTFWSSDELAKRLNEILNAEGYSSAVGLGSATSPPVMMLSISAINTVIVFAADQPTLDHVSTWAADLDSPAKGGAGNGYFTYQVKYADAEVLAATLRQVISGQTGASTETPAQAVGGPAPAPARVSATRVVVDQATNSLIFQGNAEEYTQWIGLLKDLDRPVKSALVEVTVAEVTLTDTTSLGVEWSLANVNSSSGTYTTSFNGPSASSSSGSSSAAVSAAGLTITRLVGSTPRAVLTALASGSKVKVLSSPRIVARNGELATIQVGNQVPIITSQQSNANTGGTSGVLQTVEYKDTGVILKVKPVIHAGGRVELEVTQEVSGANATQTGVNISPTISTRKINTRLSLRDGASVMLGGMISQSDTAGDAGIPLLKDIPVLGQLFRNSTTQKDRTELIIMITPYVINDDYEAEELTEAFRKQLGPWAAASGAARTSRPTPVGSAIPAASKTAVQAEPAEAAPTAAVSDKNMPVPSAETLPEAPLPAPMPTAETVTAPSSAPGGGQPDAGTPPAPAAPSTPAGVMPGKTVTDPAILKEIEQALKQSSGNGK